MTLIHAALLALLLGLPAAAVQQESTQADVHCFVGQVVIESADGPRVVQFVAFQRILDRSARRIVERQINLGPGEPSVAVAEFAVGDNDATYSHVRGLAADAKMTGTLAGDPWAWTSWTKWIETGEYSVAGEAKREGDRLTIASTVRAKDGGEVRAHDELVRIEEPAFNNLVNKLLGPPPGPPPGD